MTARQLLRRGPGLRPRARWLLGAVLTLVGVLAPVESPDLPGPLDGLYGTAAAHAQTPNHPDVIAGTPDTCPQDSTDTRHWTVDTNDNSRCLLERPACAENPVKSGTFLVPSTEFPDFCEGTILQSVDATAYSDCTALTGVVVKVTTGGGDSRCRIIQSTRCEPGLHRVGFNKCVRVERRTWTCTAGTTRRNEFNSCYRPPSDHTGTHPACGVGKPSFAIVQCEDYVDEDFVRTPVSVLCSSYTTGEARSQLQALVNRYWCRYDTSFLDVACHAAGAACATEYALCLKRASATGGCAAVAHTIRCRSLQADYDDGSKTAAKVYDEGCAPCVVLPFKPNPDCPTELVAGPRLGGSDHTRNALRFKEDFQPVSPQCLADMDMGTLGPVCLSLPTCADPPRGRLVAESSHHSRAAIVNSPITLRVEDTPSRIREVRRITAHPRQSDSAIRPPLRPERYFEYAETTSPDPTIRTWGRPDPGSSYDDVSVLSWEGECRIADWPEFRVIVEELWPDTDEQEMEIVKLFGNDSLAFWQRLLTAEKKRRTEARGLVFIDSSTPKSDKDNELMRRAGALTQELRCNHGEDVWCRWTPRRPGFFSLKAVGGWRMRTSGGRLWRQSQNRNPIDTFLMNEVAASNRQSGESYADACPHSETYHRRYTDEDCIRHDLQAMGYASPAEAGLREDLRGLLPLPQEVLTLPEDQRNEWLYTDAAVGSLRCPPRDLRVNCVGGGSTLVNYTESEPIGVLVHEVRVNTVMPSR